MLTIPGITNELRLQWYDTLLVFAIILSIGIIYHVVFTMANLPNPIPIGVGYDVKEYTVSDIGSELVVAGVLFGGGDFSAKIPRSDLHEYDGSYRVYRSGTAPVVVFPT